MRAILPRVGIASLAFAVLGPSGCVPAPPAPFEADAALRGEAGNPAIVAQPSPDTGWTDGSSPDDGDPGAPSGDAGSGASAAVGAGDDAADDASLDGPGLTVADAAAADPLADAPADAVLPPSGGSCASNADASACGAACMACPAPPANATASCAPSGGSFACEWACNKGFLACGGACVDSQKDAKNCGACGHDCTPGTCAKGVCQPWVVASYLQVAGPQSIACDGQSVIWLDAMYGQVLQVPAAGPGPGGVATPIVLGTLPATSSGPLALSALNVAWMSASPNGGDDLDVALEGLQSSGRLFLNSLAPSVGLALDPAGVTAYFDTVESTAQGKKATLEGCDLTATDVSTACKPLASFLSSEAGPLAVDDSAVFWTDPGNGLVSRYQLAGGNVSASAIGQAGVGPLALDASSVYWITNANGAFTVLRTSKQSPATPTVVATGSGASQAVVSDGAHVYFATTSGQIFSAPVGGGSLTTLHSNLAMTVIPGLVYAAGAIYWPDTPIGPIYGLRVP